MGLYKSVIDRLRNQHESIGNILIGIDPYRLNFHPETDKWSIHDNIAHLAKYQPLFMDRINAILEKDNPGFGRYIAEKDPDFEMWRSYDTQYLLQILATDRRTIFDLLTNLQDERLNRTGVHEKYGKLTILQWTEFFLLHEAHHIFTIFQFANGFG